MAFSSHGKTPSKNVIERYGIRVAETVNPLALEIDMIKLDGEFWNERTKKMCGNGLLFHFKEAVKLLWPEIKQHRWFDLFLDNWLKHRYVGVIGPKNCVAGTTRILNPLTGDEPTIQELCESENQPVVLTLDGPVLASVPFVKGVDDLYEVKFSSGERFTSTSGHRVLTDSGYVEVCSLEIGQVLQGYGHVPRGSTLGNVQSVHFLNEARWSQTIPGSQDGYQTYPCSCDERPHLAEGISLGEAPSLNGVQEYDWEGISSRSGDLGNKQERTHPYRPSSRLASEQPLSLSGVARISSLLHALEGSCEPHAGLCESFEQFRQAICVPVPSEELDRQTCNKHQFPFSLDQYKVQQTRVTSIKRIGRGFFYDLNVPGPNHYFAEGAIHHNSGKTCNAAVFHLLDYYCFPTQTTVLVCSTTKEMLENRIWGEMKKLHRLAKDRFRWLPGNLIEGRQRIVTDQRHESVEGRDFRNGLMGIPLKKGGAYVGISDIIGIKNKRKRLCGDELQALPKAFIDATANFIEPGADCKVTGMGNPADTTDSLGILCQPHPSIGGWEGGIDQTPKSKAWKTKFERGVCVQLPGSDSPNNDVLPTEPIPFPFLMTNAQMEEDARTWGKEDWHYAMFNEGRMPRGQGNRRIITRQLCLKHHAMEQAIWQDNRRTKITFLDAAYRGVGGDRCVFGELDFGEEAFVPDTPMEMPLSAIVTQKVADPSRRPIIALIDLLIIPIAPNDLESPEDQIVMFVKHQNELRQVPPENFYYDAGMRSSLVTAFGRLYTPKVNSIDFGGKPSERRVASDIDVACRDYYDRFVTELWYSVRLIIEGGQFRQLTNDVIDEGCAREWKHMPGSNKIGVETKDEMKEKTGKSPDLFDALVCGVEGARQKGFQIKRAIAAAAVSTDQKWKRELIDRARTMRESKQLIYSA